MENISVPLNTERKKCDYGEYSSPTTEEQRRVEALIEDEIDPFVRGNDPTRIILNIDEHVKFLKNSLFTSHKSYADLDCSRTWLCYWICHSLNLLKAELSDDEKSRICRFLSLCQSPLGGFGGGPEQQPHLAATYAAVMALCSLNTEQAYSVINRSSLEEFLWSVRNPDGGFRMEIDGENDIRGAYCAVSVATLTNLPNRTKLFHLTPDWIASCQTYEGGFGGCPGAEAHGGYSFCGIASLALLSSTDMCDCENLLRWVCDRQCSFSGGFQGRTNKLTDGCYSFWQAAIFPILCSVLYNEKNMPSDWGFDSQALQEYILLCCQCSGGGMRDKPGVPRDWYHTCYVLSGLSIAQNRPKDQVLIVGQGNPRLAKIDPLYNIESKCSMKALAYFNQLPDKDN